MSEQLDIWERPGNRTPRARKSDSCGSHAAADQLERSGRAAQQLAAVLDAVKRWPNRTSKELAALSGLDRYAVGRRLPELWAHGKITRCAKAGEELRWKPL